MKQISHVRSLLKYTIASLIVPLFSLTIQILRSDQDETSP